MHLPTPRHRPVRPSRRAVLAVAAATVAATLVPAVATAPPAAATTGWTWQAFTYNGDFWQRSSYNGVAQFDYRLGAGGSIAEMRYCPAGYRALLSPSYAGEETDRVVQSVLWGMDTAPKERYYDRWNIDQAGNMAGAFTRTIAVEQPNATTTDVWTVADLQWISGLTGRFAGSDTVPQLTRYTRLDNGALQIRRVLRIPKIVDNGATLTNQAFYLENWVPFMRSSDTFDALATSLNADGSPGTWYPAASVPDYPETPVAGTTGYSVVFKQGATTAGPNVAVVQSTGAGQKFGTAAALTPVRNSLPWSNGIGALPGVHITNSQTDSIIDFTVRIVPNGTLNAAVAAGLADQVNQVPAPTLYGPGYTLPGELAGIATRLRGYLASPAGTRTSHLGGL
ncbi:hypothetical protein SAMN05216371_1255 [Streptomyces sp. TLI_053]|uniref:hypothetical protein n=1 Tax=Streptomyces sp. TLI_053 TaxID=1855352 RepID=UPI00087D1176|nr:hypothetical protein [Streptomyces sp. TLI_053]SDT08557.1 hypothetical protein SAMN05216371_1255 [Streptomyces sp. TLI_053]